MARACFDVEADGCVKPLQHHCQLVSSGVDSGYESNQETSSQQLEYLVRNIDFISPLINDGKAFVNLVNRNRLLPLGENKRADKDIFHAVVLHLRQRSLSKHSGLKHLSSDRDVQSSVERFMEILKSCLDPIPFKAITSCAVFTVKNSNQSVQIDVNLDIFVIRLEKTSVLDIKYTQISTEFRTVLNVLAETVQTQSSKLHKKLKLDYKMQSITIPQLADANCFSCTLKLSSHRSVVKLLGDIQNGTLSKVMKEFCLLTHEPSKQWKFYVRLPAVGAQHEPHCFGGTHSASDDVKTISVPKQQNKQLTVLCNLLQTIISDKKFSPYDLWECLRNARERHQYRSPWELQVENGVPLLHACIDAARFSLIHVIFLLGWFTQTSQIKVPQSSASALRGQTAYDVAESKKQRKALDEYKFYKGWEDSLCDVMRAARRGDKDLVMQLIAVSDEQIHYRDSNNGNALYWAVVNGDVEILTALLDRAGLDPLMRTRKSETLIHVAAALGQHQLIKLLIEKCKIDPLAEDCHKKSPLDKVAENGDIKTLKAFLACNIHPKENFIVLSAYNGRRRLLEHCINELKLSKDARDLYERTPLLRAVEAGHEVIVDYLLALGADVTAVSSTKRNVLHYAAESGNLNILNKLIRELKKRHLLSEMLCAVDRFNGVECCFLIRGRDKGRDAWHYVEVKRQLVPLFLLRTRSGNVDVAQFGKVLVSGWGLNPDQEKIEEVESEFKRRRRDSKQPPDQTPIHIAIFKGHVEAAKILLRNGTDVSIKDNFGLTPMMAAAAKNMTELIKELEDQGADTRAINKDGQTALQIAEENQHEEVVNYMNGRDYNTAIERFLKTDVTRLVSQLSAGRLESVRSSGQDVQRHIIDTLREFKIDINEKLVEIGSSPILEESTS